MCRFLKMILVVVLISVSSTLFGQATDNYASINIYRLKESAMSGGRALGVKIFFNGKKITSLQSNTKLNYKLYSTGHVKIKFVAGYGEMVIGSPYVEEMELEKGKEYDLSIKAGSMFGVKGEIVKGKKLKKIKKNEFADTINLEEKK